MWNYGCDKKTGVAMGAMLVIFLPALLGLVNRSDHEKGARRMISGVSNTNDAVFSLSGDPKEGKKEEKEMVSKDVLGYTIEMLDGTQQELEAFRGSVVLMVNVASACGLTPQYEGLEALYRKHKKDGLVIIGFPANDFNAQEPGTNEEIAKFCSSKYDVTFPMAAKIHVKGKEVHPLYKQLAGQPEPIGQEPEWNFAKFLVNRKGEVVARFASRTPPEDPGLVKQIDVLLGEE